MLGGLYDFFLSTASTGASGFGTLGRCTYGFGHVLAERMRVVATFSAACAQCKHHAYSGYKNHHFVHPCLVSFHKMTSLLKIFEVK
jgi:hypothetical protein